MASRNKVAAAALVLSALAGFGAHQARAGVLIVNLRLLAPWTKFASSADPVCARLWVAEAQNDPALRCYLTVNTARLCGPQERLHLAHVMRRYRWDAAMLSVNAIISVVKPITMPVAGAQKIQQAEKELSTRLNERSGAKHELKSLREITEKRMDNIAKARPATLDAAFEVETLARSELVGLLRSNARAGFMQKGDFGWMPGSLVEEAFDGVATPRTCGFISRGIE